MAIADRLAALSPEQRALFERLRKERQPSPASHLPPPVRRVSGPDGAGDWPLSFDQERLWRLHQERPDLVSWNVDAGSHVQGDLDARRFVTAFHDVVRRHAALRATFPTVDGRPVQRIVPFLAPATSVIDLTALPAALREHAGHRAIYEHTRQPFDLSRGPLLRLALVRLGEREHLFLLTIHHAVTDWITFQILFQELLQIYEARRDGRPPALPEPPVQFPDYVLWEREWLEGEVLAAEAGFWRRELDGFPLVLELPGDRPRPAVQSQRGGLYRIRAGAAVSDRLRELARREGGTTFMAVLAVLAAVLGRVSGLQRFVLGSNGANRPRPELAAVAGFFLNQIPFAADVSGDPTFGEILARVRRAALAAYKHQNLPFSKLIEALGAADDGNRYPVVQALLLLLAGESGSEIGDLRFEPVGLYDGNSRWDLMFGLYDYHDVGLTGPLEYNADLFDGATIGRILDLFYRTLDAVTADPQVRLSALPELTAEARLEVITEAEDPAVERAAAALADRLRRHGTVPGVKVAVLLAPSPQSAAAVLAVERLGGLCVLLDPGDPVHALKARLADADLAVLIHQGDLGALPPPVGAVRIDIARLGEEAP